MSNRHDDDEVIRDLVPGHRRDLIMGSAAIWSLRQPSNKVKLVISVDQVKVFKALGHQFRLQVVMALLQGNINSCCGELRSYEQGCCVTDLTDVFDMSQSTISHHLGILVDAGIVKMDKRGLWSVYLISTETIKDLHNAIGRWLSCSCESLQSLTSVSCDINPNHE